MIINDKLKGISKQMTFASFKVLSWNMFWGTEQNTHDTSFTVKIWTI